MYGAIVLAGKARGQDRSPEATRRTVGRRKCARFEGGSFGFTIPRLPGFGSSSEAFEDARFLLCDSNRSATAGRSGLDRFCRGQGGFCSLKLLFLGFELFGLFCVFPFQLFCLLGPPFCKVGNKIETKGIKHAYDQGQENYGDGGNRCELMPEKIDVRGGLGVQRDEESENNEKYDTENKSYHFYDLGYAWHHSVVKKRGSDYAGLE